MQGEAISSHATKARLAGAAALVLALAGPLATRAAPGVGAGVPFAVEPGEAVTLGPGDGLNLTVSGVGRAPAEAEGPPAPRGETSEHMMSAPLTFGAAPGTLRFTLWNDAANGARLKLENGLDRAVIYSAEIVYRSTGKAEATTICSVGAGRPAVESWPNDLAAVRITGLYDAPPGAQVCGYADRGELSAPPSFMPAPPQ